MKHYDRLVPSDSFMGRYLAYMQRQETAHSFDWWAGLWCISAACGRRIHVARPRAPVYLNMYTIFIGESGVARKTTSVQSAGNLVQHLLADDNDIGFLNAKMTGEALDLYLHERSTRLGSAQLCISIPELAVFMGTEKYVANMPTILTDLYDCPAVRHGGGTIARGESIQRDVWLSFISASTPIWLHKTVNPNIVEGGFTSRCLFVVSNEPKRKIAWLDDDYGAAEDYDHLLRDLQHIREVATKQRTITLTDGALSTFRSWYGKRTQSLDAFKQSFEAREDAHVLRVAALMCINSDAWTITSQYINTSIKLVEELKENSSYIFESAEARTKFVAALDRVRSQLVGSGMDPIPRAKLYSRCRHTLDNVEFSALLDVLHELGAISRYEVRGERGGVPTMFIRGTQLLLARGLGEQVLERFV